MRARRVECTRVPQSYVVVNLTENAVQHAGVYARDALGAREGIIRLERVSLALLPIQIHCLGPHRDALRLFVRWQLDIHRLHVDVAVRKLRLHLLSK